MKSSKLSILATVAVLFTPVAATAGDSAINIQTNKNSAAAVGDANVILQQAHQNNRQVQVGVGKGGYPYGYGYGGYKTPSTQTSVQGNVNEAAAIGKYNVVDQKANQNNHQTSVDVNKYIPSYLGH